MLQNIELYRWLTLAFSLLMLLKALSHFRHKLLTNREFIAWALVWGTVIGLTIFPDLLAYTAAILGIKDSVNGFFALWLVIITYATLRLFISSEKNKKAVTELTRYLALKEFEDEKNKTTRNHRIVHSQPRRDGEIVSGTLPKS